MTYDLDLIGAKLRRWENYLKNFQLPQWDDLPDMDLYMDQVVLLLQRYLNFLPEDEHGNAAITASIINNYVRLKIMPPPVKKRYTRVHLAYLIMICSLKQSININYIQTMLPLGLSAAEVRRIYESYVSKHREMCLAFIQLVRTAGDKVLHDRSAQSPDVEQLIFASAIVSGFSKLLAEKMLHLEGQQISDAIARIKDMEARFDRAQADPREADMEALREYMQSGQWQKDYELDEKGLLPRDLKRGVLSQDGLYNFLSRRPS